MVINKIDLLPHLRFNIENCIAFARQINPDMRVITRSAETGEGMDCGMCGCRPYPVCRAVFNQARHPNGDNRVSGR
jgi:Ni2+-binding GTPase involved in maturation of urease and hydrogenase